MRLKSKGDTLTQLSMYPVPHFDLTLLFELRKYVPNPSSVCFFIGKNQKTDGQKGEKGLVLLTAPDLTLL